MSHSNQIPEQQPSEQEQDNQDEGQKDLPKFDEQAEQQKAEAREANEQLEQDLEDCENKEETIQKIDRLQNAMDKALLIVGIYRNEIDELKNNIGTIKDIVLKRDEEDKQRVVPIVQQLSVIYKEEFGKLSIQNRKLEDELQVAIAEKQVVVDEIYSCVDKIKILEDSIYQGQMPPYLKRRLEEQKKLSEKAEEESTAHKEIDQQSEKI